MKLDSYLSQSRHGILDFRWPLPRIDGPHQNASYTTSWDISSGAHCWQRTGLSGCERSNIMNIGDASKASGISVKMLRYYEQIGLVRPALREHSGYRVYSDKEIEILRFVRRARDLGFQVRQIASLLDLWQDAGRASADVKSLALGHIRALEERRRELDEMIAVLEQLARHCHGDARPDCPILAGLGSAETEPQSPARKGTGRQNFAPKG